MGAAIRAKQAREVLKRRSVRPTAQKWWRDFNGKDCRSLPSDIDSRQKDGPGQWASRGGCGRGHLGCLDLGEVQATARLLTARASFCSFPNIVSTLPDSAGFARSARQREPAGSRSSLLQAQTDRRRGPALHTVRCPSARAEHGHERFAGVAIDGAIRLYRADIYGRRISLVSLVAFWPLRPLRPLCAGWPLRTGDALNTLGTLGTGRPLRAGIALWPGLSSAAR